MAVWAFCIPNPLFETIIGEGGKGQKNVCGCGIQEAWLLHSGNATGNKYLLATRRGHSTRHSQRYPQLAAQTPTGQKQRQQVCFLVDEERRTIIACSYRVGPDQWISNTTILVLQLVQSVVKMPKNRRKNTEEEHLEDPSSKIEPDTIVRESFRETQKLIGVFLSGFLNKWVQSETLQRKQWIALQVFDQRQQNGRGRGLQTAVRWISAGPAARALQTRMACLGNDAYDPGLAARQALSFQAGRHHAQTGLSRLPRLDHSQAQEGPQIGHRGLG